jgi:hypothetical protein
MMKITALHIRVLAIAGGIALTVGSCGVLTVNAQDAPAAQTTFGPSNPFYAPSALPFQAPPFDKIKDADYQPALEAGMAQQLTEVQAIADNPDAPTFENTIVALEKTGQSREFCLQRRHRREHGSGVAESAGDRSSQTGRAARCDLPERQTIQARANNL